MSKFGPWTPGTIPDDYEARVKTDTRNILEKTILRALSTGFNSQKPNSTQPSTEGKESSAYPSTHQGKENNPPPSSQSISAAEFEKLFSRDDDVDDSEEIFQQIIKRAEEAAKRDIERNKKNPLLAILNLNMTSGKNKTRKRKNRVFEKSLDIMNRFKKSLVEPLEVAKPPEEKTISTLNTISSSNVVKPIIKNSSYPEGDTTGIKVYPKWKTTATYTPIFHSTTNPNWTNINSLAESDKMYTPGHISSWLSSAIIDSHCTEQPTSKSFRSNIATVASSSILKNSEKSIINKETPIESDPAISNVPKRSTIVRFKSSSPEKIPWDSDGISSISSKSFIDEGTNFEQFQDSDDENNDYYYFSPKQNENKNYYFTPMPNQTFERYQKCSEKYTISDEQHISKYNYEASLKNIETPILTGSLNSSTPIQMNLDFKPSPPENIPLNGDDQSSISSISLMGDNMHFKQLVDSGDENSMYNSKKCQQYPQRKQLFKIHQEYSEELNFTGKKHLDVSPLENLPWNWDNQSSNFPISLMRDKIYFNQFEDSDDEIRQYCSKPFQQQKKLLTVHREYKEKFNFTSKLNPNRLKENVADAPFVMQKFANTLTKKLNHYNYDMEVKCSVKLTKKKLF